MSIYIAHCRKKTSSDVNYRPNVVVFFKVFFCHVFSNAGR